MGIDPNNFKFRLGRMRLNVDRKREMVEKHQEELEQMILELQLTCPHTEVETVPVPVLDNDFHAPRNQVVTRCKYCGYVHRRG